MRIAAELSKTLAVFCSSGRWRISAIWSVSEDSSPSSSRGQRTLSNVTPQREKRMALGDVHKFRGCNVSYVLKCEGGDEGWHAYVGSTCDVEQRMARHGAGRGAVATRTWPPTGEILHIREHETAREAMLAEVALWSLWAGKIGHNGKAGTYWKTGRR